MDQTPEYQPARFFLATFAVSWLPWIAAAYLAQQKGMEVYALLLNLIGLLGPLAVAVALIRKSRDPLLKSDFKNRIVNLRMLEPVYVVGSVLVPFAVTYLSIWLSLFLGQPRDQFALSADVATIALALLLAPVIEELGWRGYGVDSLRARMGMLPSSLMFGLLWSLWHAPLVLVAGTYQNQLAQMDNPIFLVNFFVSVVPIGIIANWLYYKHNRSILGVVLFHSMLNGAAVLVNAGQVAKCIVTLVYLAISVAIILLDRETFREGPRNFILSTPSTRSP